uniref:DUF7054 domain-containing protein n=1 Tax=Musa acuminata subsp. malaccensis TaxID=214687 RepID=A0A804JGD3_MUSAM
MFSYPRTLQLFMKDIQVPGVIVTPLHNQEVPFRALNLVQWADDDALSAEAPPDSAAQGPTGSGGVLGGERDGAAEPVAGVGDGVHRLESREPGGGGGAAALRQGRQAAATAFGLQYSRFSLECLDPKEMLIDVGSRNFFLCLNPATFHKLLATTVRMIDDLRPFYSHHCSASAPCSQYTQKPFDELTSTHHDRTMNIIPISPSQPQRAESTYCKHSSAQPVVTPQRSRQTLLQ